VHNINDLAVAYASWLYMFISDWIVGSSGEPVLVKKINI